jgi:hypothetical protein
MKRLLIAMLVLLAATVVFGQVPTAIPPTGVNFTPHDLSANNSVAYATDGGPITNRPQSCRFCHSPHRSRTGMDPALLVPLWRHANSTATYTMYTNATVAVADLQGSSDAQPTGASLACLSCHDGTIGVGQLMSGSTTYLNTPIIDATGHLTGTPFTSDLTTVHPIGITYVAADGGLKDPSTFAPGTVKIFPHNAWGNKVQCGSCHDPHNYGERFDTTNQTGYGDGPFLRDTMGNVTDPTSTSRLCLDCHNK